MRIGVFFKILFPSRLLIQSWLEESELSMFLILIFLLKKCESSFVLGKIPYDRDFCLDPLLLDVLIPEPLSAERGRDAAADISLLISDFFLD